MKKKLLCICAVLLLSATLAGCKSSDYEKAVEFEQSGDYLSALTIYESLDGYEDSNERAATCSSMIEAIDNFSKAKEKLDALNLNLDTAISDAESLIATQSPALDEALFPALETAISACKASRTSVPEMPATAEEIAVVIDDLNNVDYSTVLSSLDQCQTALETSIQQYALVNAPSEAFIIECLMQVPGIMDISAATEDNDPNGHLNKAGGYTAQIYFSHELIPQNSVYGSTVIEKGTDCGGSIEVYSNVEDVEKRNTYLASFDGTIFATGSHTIVGTVLVRTSDKLTASQQKELEANIISVLTSLE